MHSGALLDYLGFLPDSLGPGESRAMRKVTDFRDLNFKASSGISSRVGVRCTPDEPNTIENCITCPVDTEHRFSNLSRPQSTG